MKQDKQWILSKGGKVYGPYSFEQLKSFYEAKKVGWTDLVVELSDSPKAVEWLRVGSALVSDAEEAQDPPTAPALTVRTPATAPRPSSFQSSEVVLDTGRPESTGPENLGFRRTISGSVAFTVAGDGSGIFVGKGECRDIGARGMTIASGQIPGQCGSLVGLKIAPPAETTIPEFSTEAIIRWISHEGREFAVEFTALEEEVRAAIQMYVTGKVKLRRT